MKKWTLYQDVFYPPLNATEFAVAFCCNGNRENTVYVDDVKLEKIDEGPAPQYQS